MRSAVLIVLIVAEGFTLLEQTAVPFWGQTTQMLSTLCPKRNCSPKRVKRTFWAEPACCLELEMATLRSMPRDLSTVARITATFSHDSPCVRRTHGMQIRKRKKKSVLLSIHTGTHGTEFFLTQTNGQHTDHTWYRSYCTYQVKRCAILFMCPQERTYIPGIYIFIVSVCVCE